LKKTAIYIAPFEAKACQDAQQLFVPSTATRLLAIESLVKPADHVLSPRNLEARRLTHVDYFVRCELSIKIGSFYVHLVDLEVVAGGIGEDCVG
jgi:hypothetical protein